MNQLLRRVGLAALLTIFALAAGCSQERREDATNPEAPEAHAAGDGHNHEEETESPSGAAFKAGKGVTLTEETAKILGLEVAEVVESPLPAVTRLTAQIFGERHYHLPNIADHSGCDVHGSGLVSRETAATINKGDRVQIRHGENGALDGVVLAVQTALALGESEIIIGISNAISVLHPGEFVPASVIHPSAEATITIPTSALLRTAEGTFVYAVNGDAFLKTPVKIGAETEDRVSIIDGLLPGDQVVVQPVQTLWLIELRATKGGGHSH